MHRHLHVAASLASTTALGYLRRHQSRVQQSLKACPVVCLHLDACSQWLEGVNLSVSLPRPLSRTSHEIQCPSSAQGLDSSKRCLHTRSCPTTIIYRVPVTAIARLDEAARTTILDEGFGARGLWTETIAFQIKLRDLRRTYWHGSNVWCFRLIAQPPDHTATATHASKQAGRYLWRTKRPQGYTKGRCQ